MDAPNTPLYPFGFGLSYTTFRIDELNLSAERVQNGESVRVSVQVENTGNRAGGSGAALSARCVRSDHSTMRQLKGFQKVALEAGEKRQVEFVVLPEDMSFLDEAWKMTVEAGEFEVFVGNSVNGDLMGKFTVEGSTPTAAPTGATTVITSTQASSAQSG
ncbi:hypothetical protein BV898_17455 [Hypsibius exemplaris]|uniref:beta-glucosidase n=1 Tax=Hypsibius exemplaris TaxID=2072580 RepID=A0A9X6NHP9_HYPEX|nr:hypothetical protein BV898_17455 [Hypsibius exemplaris]